MRRKNFDVIDLQYPHNIKYIVHIADVHIRKYHRHQEYTDVFNKLYEDLRQYPEDETIVYIAGDIIHTKNDISPETVYLLNTFLRQLLDLFPVFIITGNHDVNLNNKSRMTAVGSVLQSFEKERHKLYYLNKTAVYKTNNVDFIVWNIEDNIKDFINPKYHKTDNKKIVLWHGALYQSSTDIGYVIESNKINKDSFVGCELALLGDIHKRQLHIENDTIIHYAGSLIQQNFGESISGHGYTLWDVTDNSYTYHDIKNEYAYCTFEVDSGKIKTEPDEYTDNARVRIIYENTEQEDKRKLYKKIIRKFKNVLFVEEHDILVHNPLFDDIKNNDQRSLTDVTYQNELIEKYLTTKYPSLSKEIISKILVENIELNKQLDKDIYYSSRTWKPLSFSFDNMYSFGEHNHIDFRNMKGIYGIFGPNASGKSAVIDSLSMSMYDRCSRTYKPADICNFNSDGYNNSFVFTVNDMSTLTIERTYDKKYNKSLVNFYETKPDGEIVDLNNNDRRGTNAEIQKYLGNFDLFSLTSLSLQGKDSLFVEKSQAERKDILAKFLCLDIFQDLFGIANDKLKYYNSVLQYIDKDKLHLDLKSLQEEYNVSSCIVEECTVEIDTLHKQLDSVNKKIERNRKLIKHVQGLSDTVTEGSIQESIKNIESVINTYQNDLNTLWVKFDTSNVKLQTVVDRIETLDGDTLKVKIKEAKKSKQEYDKTKQQLINVTKLFNTKQKTKEHLETHEYDPECPYCVKTNSENVKQLSTIQKELDELTTEKAKLFKTKDSLHQELEQARDTVKLFEEYSTLCTERNTLLDTIKSTDSEIKITEEKLRVQELRLINTLKEQDIYNTHKSTLEKNNKVQLVIDSLTTDKKELNDSIYRQTTQKNDSDKRCYSLLDKIKETKNKLAEYYTILSKKEVYDYYVSVLKKDGLSYILIQQSIPEIAHHANKILEQVIDFSLELEIDGNNIVGNIVYPHKRYKLEMCSGMEKFMISMALRIALIKVSKTPKPNFLIIDEGWGVLDPDNMSSMYKLFDYLEKEFQFVIVISHIFIIKDLVTHTINLGVSNENGVTQSKITHQ